MTDLRKEIGSGVQPDGMNSKKLDDVGRPRGADGGGSGHSVRMEEERRFKKPKAM